MTNQPIAIARRGEHGLGRGRSHVEFPTPVAIAAPQPGLAVTATIGAQDELRLHVLDVTAEGQFVRRGETTGDRVFSVAAAALGPDRLVTAAGSGSGLEGFRFDFWDIMTDGPPRPAGTAHTDDLQAFSVALVALSRSRLASAVLDSRGGDLGFSVDLWDIEADSPRMSLVRRANARERFAAEAPVALVALGEHRLVTAHTEGQLRLMVWDVTADGQLVRRGENAENVRNYVLALTALGPNRLATTHFRPGQIELVIWEVDAEGRVVRVGGEQASSPSHFDATVTPLGTDRFVTGWPDEHENLALILWEVNPAGGITQLGRGTAASLRSLATAVVGPHRLAVAGIDGQENVVVGSWDVEEGGTSGYLRP